MPSRCQTLSEYIKRRQQAQDLKLAKFDTSSSLGTDKQFTDLITSKKQKVHFILSEILTQLKRTNHPSSYLSTIQTLITKAQRQIDNQFQHIYSEVNDKLRHKGHLFESKQDQRSESSIDKRLRDKVEGKKQTHSDVLREVKTENHMVDVRQGQRGKEKNQVVVRKKKQGKEGMNLKQNQVEESNKVRNPEEDCSEKSLFYTFNGLGKDRKQLVKQSKISKPSKLTINNPGV